MIKVVTPQDSYFKLLGKKSGETSINLSTEIANYIMPNISIDNDYSVKFVIFKEDFIKAIGYIINILPLYTSSSTTYSKIESATDVYNMLIQKVDDFFKANIMADYTANLKSRDDGRYYLNQLDNNGFNIRDFLVAYTSILDFNRVKDTLELHICVGPIKNACSEMTSDERKDAFFDYLKKRTKSGSTINNYKRASTEYDNINVGKPIYDNMVKLNLKGSLFDYYNIETISMLHNSVLNDPNNRIWNQTCSATVKAYREFLIDLITFKQVSPTLSNTSNHPASSLQLTDLLSSPYRQYLTAIRTKPFLLLGGFSGTGKSQKVKELAYLTCPKELQDEKTPGNYSLISVKPNWHDSTELLGYESTIANKYIVTDFMRFLVKAMQHQETPFFCCMDEMNLAPVEEYFAEFLSVLESRKKMQGTDGKWHIVSEPLVSADVFKKSYKGKDENGVTYNIFEDLGLKKIAKIVSQNETNAVSQNSETTSEEFEREDIVTILKREGLCIPENLVVIGTVNMDDTTNSFSRKVIDRAMTFETDIETFDKDKYFNEEDTLQYGNMDGSIFICDEVRADKAIEAGYELSEEDRQSIIDYVNDLNKAMAGTSFQISYRVLNEMILYYRSMKILNKGEANLEQVKNDILMMKVLPRIEGDSAAKEALVGLKAMIEKQVSADWVNVPYNIDAETIASKPETPWKDSILKISYMLNLLNTGDGFTRFWK